MLPARFSSTAPPFHPEVHVEVEKSARAAGAQSLEACMASSITQAREGTLYLMVGGEEAVFQKSRTASFET